MGIRGSQDQKDSQSTDGGIGGSQHRGAADEIGAATIDGEIWGKTVMSRIIKEWEGGVGAGV